MSELLRLLDDNDEDEDNGPGFGCASPAFLLTVCLECFKVYIFRLVYLFSFEYIF